MAYSDFRDLPRRAVSDKLLHDIAFNNAKMLNVMDIAKVLLQWFTRFFKKKSAGADTSGAAIKGKIMLN